MVSHVIKILQPANPFQSGLNSLLSGCCLLFVGEDIDLGNITLEKANLKQRMSESTAVPTRTSLEILKGAKCPVLFCSKGSVLLLVLKQWSCRCLVCVDLRNQVKATRFSGSFAAGGL